MKAKRRKGKESAITVVQGQGHFIKTGDFLKLAGITRQMLYTYLTMGLIEEADRTTSGRHLFDQRALKRVDIVKRLQESGYPLREIKDIYFKEAH